jgi:hypothetical protein
MDSSLILRAMLLIVSAVCCASTDAVILAVVSVVEVFPLTLLALAALLSSEGIVGVTIQTYQLPPLKEILSKIYTFAIQNWPRLQPLLAYTNQHFHYESSFQNF